MGSEREFPSVGETVVVKVGKVLDYGAFVELEEYDNAKGFVHVSQVASCWVKNIRNFVKENQVRAAKVLSINREKGQIDLSLTKVSPQQQRQKIEEWKQLKRARKMVELLAEQQKKDVEKTWEEIAEPLMHEYGSLHQAFQRIAVKGESAAVGVREDLKKPLAELIAKSITVSKKTVKGVLSLRSTSSTGVEVIKGSLGKGIEPIKGVEIEIYYKGGGKYVLSATSPDGKAAEKALLNSSNAILDYIKSQKGTGSFEKAEE